MDRISFLESISGIEYPEMIVEFFDQFIALKQVVEDHGEISVLEKSENGISFNITFSSVESRNIAISNVSSGTIVIYGKPINVGVSTISDTEIQIILK